ncbi:DNA oxidative demethylase ALKBH2 [Parasteatoda tepidariorum]|uniref:DNA oxidative demethylase ALKBH2 n=1 Tax=Parasteatoda tepidariorum TaxID=114398 RepID=UPI00077F99A5|nr:DNA oxidative demethylase ALKBH2 [Parasteatoda tepidariorum]
MNSQEFSRDSIDFYSSREKDICRIQHETSLTWKVITKENLNLRYARMFSKSMADYIFYRLETEIEYFSGDLSRVKVFGKWHDIPRKQVSYGEDGLSYSFSGNRIPAVPWNKSPIVAELKNCVSNITGVEFNFVLINRYKNGEDHMGDHRDDEKELVPDAPIASLSFGQNRDFIFKHKDSRGKQDDSLKLLLEHGSLLLMEWPTNRHWYHCLPVRKKALNARINLTFRKMLLQ